jgi:NAD(P)-dependent dehydrogenase (short-subunit alcohol dehydrogenase family)
VWKIDLLNNKSILAFGQRVRSELPRLDAFIANAGVELSHFSVAEDLETTLQVNVIGTFLSAIEVLPKLKETSTTYQTQTNVTFVGSMYHIMPPPEQLDFLEGVDMFEALSDKDTADMPQRYALSKLMIHQCAHELARCVSEGQSDGTQQVIVNHVNPGWCETSLTRNKPEYPFPIRLIFKLIGWTAEEGSRAVVYAALAGNETHGHYISESQVKKESHFMRTEKGRETQRRLWGSLLNRIAMADPLAPSYI